MINVKKTVKHEPLIKRTPFAKKFSACFNRYSEDDSILLEFESENGIHRIKLDREAARELMRDLSDAEFQWRYAFKDEEVCVTQE